MTLVRDDVDYVDMIYALGSLNDFLGNLDNVNHGRYLLDLFK